MPTCIAPSLPTAESAHAGARTATPWQPEHEEPALYTAPALLTCHGTDWPPLTQWQRYGAERLAGERVPPSVSTWRPQDIRRQALAEREARAAAPEQPIRVVPWGEGPACEPAPFALTHPGRSGAW